MGATAASESPYFVRNCACAGNLAPWRCGRSGRNLLHGTTTCLQQEKRSEEQEPGAPMTPRRNRTRLARYGAATGGGSELSNRSTAALSGGR